MDQAKEGDVIQIPELLKSKYREWAPYSAMQFIGSSQSLTLLMSILDFHLANNNIEQLKTLVNPNKPYTRYAQEIAQKIKSCILQDRNLSEFYHSASINDPNYTRTDTLLFEFCNYHYRTLIDNLLQTLITLSKALQLSFCVFGDYFLKVDTQKPMIFIYMKNNQYYYIKQFNENQQSTVNQINPSQCNEQQHQNQNCEADNFCGYDEFNHLFKLKVIEVYKESEEWIDNRALQIKKINQKELVKNQIEQENQQDNNQDNSTKSHQTCMNCNQATQSPLFVNSTCNHHFCSKCLNQTITNFDINYKCLNRDCSSLIDLFSYIEYCSGEAPVDKREETINLEFKPCSNCGKNQLKRKSIQSAQKNSLCIKCLRKSTQTLDQAQISNHQEYYLEKVNGNNLNEKAQSILFGCSKCKVKINKNHQHFNKNCLHLLCFSCSNDLILNGNRYSISLKCPVPNCTQYLNQPDFDRFFEEQQNKLLQEQEQKQKEQKEEILIQPLEHVTKEQNLEQQMEIQMTEEEELHYQTFGQCTLCYTDFSNYNKRQKLDCKMHQIGVCCSLKNLICPQCSQKQCCNSNNFINITGQFKLRKDSKQTFDSYQFQFD
ncbi:unnamed protein product [Paramecium octaurelia]|uniref:RING-type domain-containing protein n=1 Tax=Paramecium octaurelia TaxID=43137 RepID=A0A8S1VZ68_PAROT|nr:unnamed protein product [Paramecium octaurelia]